MDNHLTLACSLQEDDIAVDLFFLTIDGKSLWKRIEDIENILNDLKKSHLLNQDSSSSSKIVAEDTNKEETDDMHRSIKWEVFGRDKEREHICSMLRKGSDADGPTSSSSKPYSVFGIHGITGSGKTTLAKYVCDLEKKAEDKHFDHVMFIHVSETFRIDKIFRDMLSEMGQQSDSNGVTALHNELKKNLEENVSCWYWMISGSIMRIGRVGIFSLMHLTLGKVEA